MAEIYYDKIGHWLNPIFHEKIKRKKKNLLAFFFIDFFKFSVGSCCCCSRPYTSIELINAVRKFLKKDDVFRNVFKFSGRLNIIINGT